MEELAIQRGRVLIPGTGGDLRRLRPDVDAVAAARFDQVVVVVGRAGRLQAFDATTLEKVADTVALSDVRDVEFGPDAVTVHGTGGSLVYDPTTLKRRRS